jgi:phosphatidylglycerol:prolipoprotein diacylglycerol transferase
MLPVLFELVIPAGWTRLVLVLALVLLVLSRALPVVLEHRRAGKPGGLGRVLRQDAWVSAVALVIVAGLWRSAVLDHEVRLPLNTYGLLLASAFLVGIWLAQREARRQGQDPARVADLSFYLLVAGWLGSDVYYKLVNWREFLDPSASTFWSDSPVGVGIANAASFGLLDVRRVPAALLPQGLVFYGGFIAAILTGAWYMRRHRLPFLAYADTVLPSLAFGHFLGRLGCFGAGCCWGRVGSAHLPWLVRFPARSMAYQAMAGRDDAAAYVDLHAHTTLPLHPVQLYEAFGELAIFLLLVLWFRPRKAFHGQVLAAWLALYAVLRTVVELFRGDVERGVALGLGAGQWTSIAILLVGAIVWVRARRLAGGAAPAIAP